MDPDEFIELKKQIRLIKAECTRAIRSGKSLIKVKEIQSKMSELHSKLLKLDGVDPYFDIEKAEIDVLNYETRLKDYIKSLEEKDSLEMSQRFREIMNWSLSQNHNNSGNGNNSNSSRMREDVDEENSQQVVQTSHEEMVVSFSSSTPTKKQKSGVHVSENISSKKSFQELVFSPILQSSKKDPFMLSSDSMNNSSHRQYCNKLSGANHSVFGQQLTDFSAVSKPPDYQQHKRISSASSCCRQDQSISNKPMIKSPSEININMFPKFDGKASEWPTFKKIVEKLLIRNDVYEDIVKVTVLLQIMDVEPRRLVHLAMVKSDNIQDIWRMLCEEYDSPVKLFEQINENLKQLPFVKNRDDVSNLKVIRDAVDDISKTACMFAKKNDHSTFHIINSIGNQFYYEAERHIIAKVDNFDDLRVYINRLYTEALDFEKYRWKNRKDSNNKAKPMNSAAIDGSSKCNLCDNIHPGLASCVDKLESQVVADRIKKLSLCWKCLNPGHSGKECRTYSKCSKCNRAHLSELHEAISIIVSKPKENKESSNVAAIQVASISKDMNKCHQEFLEVKVEEQMFNETRPVFKAKIKNNNCKILLDFGSEVTLISADLLKDNIAVTKPCYAEAISPLLPNNVVIYTEMVSLVLSKAGYVNVMMEAIVAPNLKNSLIIIGTDMMNRLIDKHQLSINSKFGNIDLIRRNKWMVAAVSTYQPNDQDEIALEEPEISIKCVAFGKYEARLPFLSNIRPPNNFDAALVLAKKIKNRLLRMNMVGMYKDQLFEYVNQGHAEEVLDKEGYFLPHHPVLRENNESTPLRIVFNGSFGFQSLNNLLWKGSVVGLDLLHQLVRFRKGPFATTMDISKAFLQISIHADDRKYLKFLWIEDDVIRIFQMTALPFGIISSPAILSSVVQHLLKSSNLNEVSNAIYMDDILLVKDVAIELVRLVAKVITVFKAAGFHLHKIKTNCLEVCQALDLDMVDSSKILGMMWNIKKDELCLNIPVIEELPYNRKTLLSVIGRLFDPIGIIDPIKLVLRKIHRNQLKLEWEEKFSDEVISKIKNHLENYLLLKNLAVPRNLGVVNTIHGFADASKESYGYVIYAGNKKSIQFLFGKSKLGSLKYTIVELELIALYELSVALVNMKECFEDCELVLWSDNKINLHRLESSPNKFHRKIAGTVLKLLKNIQYLNASARHIKGEHNPADIFSRMISIEKFMEQIKLKLCLEEPHFVEYEKFDVYEVASVVLKSTNQNEQTTEVTQKVQESDRELLDRILPTVSNVEDLVSKLVINGRIDKEATKQSQFHQLYSFIQRCHQVKKDKIDRKLMLFKENDIWRVKTREPDYAPIFLTNSEFAKLLILDVHKKRFHGGIKDTLAEIREKFYIVNGARLVRSVIHHCLTCQKAKAKIVKLPGGNLPKARTTLLPFEALSCDLFGPRYFKNGKKFWGLVTTCLCSRFVKIEPVKNLSAEESVLALEKIFDFIGEPKEMFSDNGTNFVKAKNSFENINWNLSPPHAPWYNGTVERIIAIIKRCLAAVDYRFTSLEDVRKAFSRIESTINTRPLFMADHKWISPFELIFARPKVINKINNQELDSSIGKLRQQLIATRKSFEKYWKSEYVRELATKYQGQRVYVVVGQRILIPELLKKRADWPVAIVTKVWPSSDGLPRVVDLDLDNKIITRPLNGLIVLPNEEFESIE